METYITICKTDSQQQFAIWLRKLKQGHCINLEGQYQGIYFQGSNGETDIENGLMDMGRGEERVRHMERVTWKLTVPKQTANGNLLYGSGNSNRGSVST